MDVVILAGGLGTRLARVWGWPKCLVPIAGKPVLGRLLELLVPLAPRQVVLVLGHDSQFVHRWLSMQKPNGLHVSAIVEAEPTGTLGAVRFADRWTGPPLLVLNGDTLPLYPLEAFVQFYRTVQCNPDVAITWHDGKHAGASILGDGALEMIRKDEEHRDLEFVLGRGVRYNVPGFLDIGTPENFYKAQHMKGDNFDPYTDAL